MHIFVSKSFEKRKKEKIKNKKKKILGSWNG